VGLWPPSHKVLVSRSDLQAAVSHGPDRQRTGTDCYCRFPRRKGERTAASPNSGPPRLDSCLPTSPARLVRRHAARTRTFALNIAAIPKRDRCARANPPGLGLRPSMSPLCDRIGPSDIGTQFTGRAAIKASRSLAALAPHRYCKLSSRDKAGRSPAHRLPKGRMRDPCAFEPITIDDAGLSK
jgi:hypothetical protein